MNVLLTAPGRRSYLVEYFRQALDGGGLVVCANSDPTSSAMRVADRAVQVPRSDHPEYVETVLDLCRRFEVALLCSLHDLDLVVLSRFRDDIRACGTVPVLPDYPVARLCLDKFEMHAQLAEVGLHQPWTGLEFHQALEALETGVIHWPLIVKDRLGFGSLGLFECHNLDDLRYALGRINRASRLADRFVTPVVLPESVALIQEKLNGEEYCLGLVSDLDGNLVSHARTEILAMRAGESDMAITRNPEADAELAEKLGALLRVPGYVGIDWIECRGKACILDINPRFTGDYPFSHLAGLNVPAALLAWARSERPIDSWFATQAEIAGHKELVPQVSKSAPLLEQFV